jgi:hypothetical protein
MLSLEQEASLALSNAVKNGVIDTVLHPFSNPIITGLLGYARERRGQHRQDPNTFEPYEHPKSTQWQESSFSAFTHAPPADWFCVEVARFVVPKGQVGFVTHIEQVVNDVQGNYYPTNQEYWGSPRFVLSDVDNIRWWLKLDFYDGQLPAARFQYNDTIPFGSEIAPGMPYSDMHTIDALWYPAHMNRPIKLIVPGMRMLRFFYYSPPTTIYQWEVRGRFTGYTQSTYSTESQANARSLND